jgi:hypothetical protein
MKKIRLAALLVLLLVSLTVNARADLNIFLGDLNNYASSSPVDYHTRLSSQFGVPQPQIVTLTRSVASPADAFMVLQLSRMLGIPHERVLYTYNHNRGRGWGVIAKEMGIKPGSAEFHALKRGDFSLNGVSGRGSRGFDDHPKHDFDDDHGGGHGKGKGKGHK